MSQLFKEKYGPWALLTGSTKGIGASLAAMLAEKGLNLILAARSQDILEEQAESFRKQYQVEVKTIRADLADPDSIGQIIEGTNQLDIGLFIPNAGVEIHGKFTDHAFEQERRMLQINVVSTMELTHHFAKKMAKRGKGGILLVSSMGGYFGNGYLSGYVATKSYLMTLGESLYYEMKPQGIDVSVLAPGLTDTAMAEAVVKDKVKKSSMATPDDVARLGLEKLGKQPVILPGMQNRLIIFLTTRILGRHRAAKGSTAFLKKLFDVNET